MYVPTLRVAVVTIFIAAQAPELVSRDLRSRVLPLYFCRPLRRGDYPLAKFLALAAALWPAAESTVNANVYVIIELCSRFGNTLTPPDEAPLRSGCVRSTFMPRRR